jgi:hypothetical protein
MKTKRLDIKIQASLFAIYAVISVAKHTVF